MVLDDFRNLRQSFFAKTVISKTPKIRQIKNGLRIQGSGNSLDGLTYERTNFEIPEREIRSRFRDLE